MSTYPGQTYTNYKQTAIQDIAVIKSTLVAMDGRLTAMDDHIVHLTKIMEMYATNLDRIIPEIGKGIGGLNKGLSNLNKILYTMEKEGMETLLNMRLITRHLDNAIFNAA